MENPVRPPQHPARHVFSTLGIAISALVILGAFTLATSLFEIVGRTNQMAAVISAALVELANEDREEESLGTLTVNPLLVAAAQAKANDMAEKGYFAHESPEGRNPWYWIGQAGYSFSYAGENLAVNFSDSEDVERAWMESPGHRANILNGKFTEIGIATAVGEYQGQKTTFVVQMFGAPKAIAAAPVREIESSTLPEEPVVATTEPIDTDILGSETSAPPVLEEPVVETAEALVPATLRSANVAATSPGSLLRLLYALCAFVILVSLALTTRLEWKRHHARHMVAAASLLIAMAGLFSLADWLIFVDPIIGGGLALGR